MTASVSAIILYSGDYEMVRAGVNHADHDIAVFDKRLGNGDYWLAFLTDNRKILTRVIVRIV